MVRNDDDNGNDGDSNDAKMQCVIAGKSFFALKSLSPHSRVVSIEIRVISQSVDEKYILV